jgi:phosphoenolpyruvate-protein phosphotransferase (PTS system enzyme I)
LVVDQEGFRIPRRVVARDAVEHELERLDAAIAAAGVEIEHNRRQVNEQLGEEYGAIFSAHLQMLRDPRLHSELEELIRTQHYSPEYAVNRALRRYAKVFQTLDKGFLSERANDIFDIEKRVLRQLLGRPREELSELVSDVIVLAHNLTPSETANLNPDFVRGFVTETGGPGSHTAIVAAALEIPAVIGTGPFLTDVSGGDLIIIDGDQGLVILQPDEETIARYRREVEEHLSRAAQLKTLRDLPAETADGKRISLYGNIEFPHEVTHCLDRGADGIGLYRTEFLYVGSALEPDEDAHYQAYAQVIQAMQGLPVVIRTLDMGADKIMWNSEAANDERNPCLGLRSIRMSLANLPLFRTQLRAVLRASVLGDVRIMFPLISTLMELRKAKMVLADVMEDLEEQHIPFNRQMPVGMMVEVPAAVLVIDRFAEEVDFLSIGTNDLVQYTLAVDRGNKDVADLYNASDPAVLRLIKLAIDAGSRAGIPVNVCGQMSAGPVYTMLLLGMGLRGFSVPPSAVPEVKEVCRAVKIPQCEIVAERALGMDHAQEIKSYLRGELKKILPDLV